MEAALQSVAEATAAVLVASRRVGSAVLVDDRHLLTAGHVLRGADDQGVSHSLELVFPARPGRGMLSVHATVQPQALSVDVTVLELAHAPDLLPRPVSLWPAGVLPRRVTVLGFPLAESRVTGVWRQFDVSGPVAGGGVQLDWVGGAGSLPGHSGGPVVDRESGALVGILIEGSQLGRFDRFVPVAVIADSWSALPRPWLIAGSEGRGHFTRRARGQRSRARGGDLFRGRRRALTVVREWMTGPEDPGRPLVVTGQPGAGKSAVVARAALTLEAERVTPGMAFHCRGATHEQLLWSVANLVGSGERTSRDALVDAIVSTRSTRPWLIMLDGLDEAAGTADRRQIVKTISELAALPMVRVSVATRALSAGDRYALGALLPALGVQSADSPGLVDLDTERYFDPEALQDYAAALLAQDSVERPGPPGTAWIAYRANSALCQRMAASVARRAGSNYLVAAMAGVALSTAEFPVDPAGPNFDQTSVPAGVGQALTRSLDQLAEAQRPRIRGLLTALAYARGGGLDDRLWLSFAAALGYAARISDLDQLRSGVASDYLLQAVPDRTGPVTRMFHQALSDELLAVRHRPSDEQSLLAALTEQLSTTGWMRASDYQKRHAAEHAEAAGGLAKLIGNIDYLTVADFARLLPLLRFGSAAASSEEGVLLQQVGGRASSLNADRRVQLLALTAAHLGLHDLHARLVAVSTGQFKPRWAHTLGAAHRELTGHAGGVSAVALGRIGSRDVIVSGSLDDTLRVWDAVGGDTLGRPLAGHGGAVSAVALGRIGHREVIVSGSDDSTLRIWDAASGHSLGGPLTGHTSVVSAVALGRIGAYDVIVSGSHDSTIAIWDGAARRRMREAMTGHTGWVVAVALGRIGARDVVVSGSHDTTLRIWDAATARPLGEPIIGGMGVVTAVALGRLGDRDVIVAGGNGTVRIWEASGRPLGEPILGHTGSVNSVALGRISDRDVIVSGDDDAVRIWDATCGRPLGAPLIGHTGAVRAVALGRVGDRDVVVSGSQDETVRIWDAFGVPALGDPLAGHSGLVRAVAAGRIGDRDVIVSGSHDRTVRIWDVASGQPLGSPLTGHGGPVSAVALGRVADRDVIVSGGWDKTVRIWDAVTGRNLHEPLIGHTGRVSAVALGQIGDRDVIVSGGYHKTVRIWDVASGQQLGKALTGHTGRVSAVALGRVGDRDVIVSGDWDDTVQIRDASSGEPLGEPLIGHTGAVSAVALGRVGNRNVIVSGSHDYTLRIWDAAEFRPLGESLRGHTGAVSAVAIGRVGQRDVIVSSSWDNTVRIWDAADSRPATVLDLAGPVSACALNPPSLIVAAVGAAVCTFVAG